MVKWKLCLGTGLLAACCFSAGAFAAGHVEDVEAISRVYGDGEKLAAVQLRYDADLLGSSVAAADYAVPGRTVAKAFVTAEPYGKAAEKGRYVQVELTPLPLSDQMADPHPEDKHKAPIGVGGPQLGSHGNPQPLVPVTASISQKGKVETVQGRIYGGEPEMKSTHTRQLLIEKFTQHTFTDSDGKTLQYNLYVPENLEKGKTYPLVLFMHDAGTVSPEVKATLSQGRGAVTWVEPRWQEEHPCFVLAPQYDTVIVDDKYQYGPELDRTIHLVESLASQYPIDTKRIYNTGQSMGCMTSIAMDVKYPQFFAGSYLVAGKWDPRVTAPLAQQNIWAVAAAGDPGAKPSMDTIMDQLDAAGDKVSRGTVAQDAPEAQVDQLAEQMIQPGVHAYYLLYQGGSHRSTWQHAYDITPAKEWLFGQKAGV
ncbi:hypothetical protein [Acidaminococcus massiliensis]|uniref:hypothetical protein n=1 Tax=Acidaminococcus massiliensis TaxID=1852375 RepID=UPI00266B3CEC|nr:hypothetical protein [Acidaminococcus massiliensis]